MIFATCPPCLRLADLIEDYWHYEGYGAGHAFERILPSGTFELVVNLAEDELRIFDVEDVDRMRRFSGAVLSGSYATPFVSDIREEASLIGVHFRPGGAAAFLGMPASEIGGDHVDLSQIWGRDAAILRERLCAAPTPVAKFRVMEAALLGRLGAPSPRRSAVEHALTILVRAHGRVRIASLAQTLDLSPRRVTDLFAADVGVTPKLFSRIHRLGHARMLMQRKQDLEAAQVAAECGYFDQSHFIHDFVEFTACTPADYLRRYRELIARGVHLKRNHLPLSG